MNMELTFPEDAREGRVRSDRNLSGFERWASIIAGAGLTAYGMSRLKNNGWMYAGLGGLLLRRGVTAHCEKLLVDCTAEERAGDFLAHHLIADLIRKRQCGVRIHGEPLQSRTNATAAASLRLPGRIRWYQPSSSNPVSREKPAA